VKEIVRTVEISNWERETVYYAGNVIIAGATDGKYHYYVCYPQTTNQFSGQSALNAPTWTTTAGGGGEIIDKDLLWKDGGIANSMTFNNLRVWFRFRNFTRDRAPEISKIRVVAYTS